MDGQNLYQYVGSNPLLYTDPDGLRKTTDREKSIVGRLDRLIAAAQAAKNPGFAGQVTGFKTDLLKMIEAVPVREFTCDGQTTVIPERDPTPLAIVLAALELWDTDPGNQWGEGSSDSKDFTSSNGAYATVPASQYKCNIFVGEVIFRAIGQSIPWIASAEQKGKAFPPRARDWGDKNQKIPFFDIVTGDPQIGDILPFGGHVGISLGHGIYISARDDANGVITNDGQGVIQHSHGIQIKAIGTPDLIRRSTNALGGVPTPSTQPATQPAAR